MASWGPGPSRGLLEPARATWSLMGPLWAPPPVPPGGLGPPVVFWGLLGPPGASKGSPWASWASWDPLGPLWVLLPGPPRGQGAPLHTRVSWSLLETPRGLSLEPSGADLGPIGASWGPLRRLLALALGPSEAWVRLGPRWAS